MRITSDSPEKTIEIGKNLGKLAEPGSIILLKGNLGAGKTHFAKGVALGLDITEHVTSPTFTIINEYQGRIPLYHVDAYRLEDEEEVFDIGLEEYIYDAGITLIEWPERINSILPAERLVVEITYSGTDDETRQLNFTAAGFQYEKLVKELKTSVHSGH